MASFLNDMKAELVRKDNNFAKLFTLSGKPNTPTKHRVRIFSDPNGTDTDPGEAVKINFHLRWDEKQPRLGYTYPCAKAYGKPCDYCKADNQEEGRWTKAHFGFLIWNYDLRMEQLLCYKGTEKTPLPGLADNYEELETLKDRDFSIRRTGEKGGLQFPVTALKPGKFSFVPEDGEDSYEVLTDPAAIHARILELMALIWRPNLLKPDFVPARQEEKAIMEQLANGGFAGFSTKSEKAATNGSSNGTSSNGVATLAKKVGNDELVDLMDGLDD